MASDDQQQRASRLYTELKISGDYPPWGEADIAEMLEQGVDDEHIKAEWVNLDRVYHDLKGGADGVLSRLLKMGVYRPDVNEHTVAEWIKNGLTEDLIRLEYLRSIPKPSMNIAVLFLVELERQTRSELPIPMLKEQILARLKSGSTGKDIALEYAAWQYDAQLLSETGGLQQGTNEDFEEELTIPPGSLSDTEGPNHILDEDLWVELHYGLLYATTHLPLEPVVLRNMHRSQDQYNAYFAPAPGIDPGDFNAKTIRLVVATVIKLDQRLDQRIKDGGHPKALNTMFISEDLATYRSIRAKLDSDTNNLDVETHHELWQFLTRLTAELHPNLAKPQDQASMVVQHIKTTKKSLHGSKKWTDAERHALWRCINTWCNENGVDSFSMDNINTDTWRIFADGINAVCTDRRGAPERTAETVQGQVRDAIRRGISVGNKPIFDLGVRAKQMVEDIKNGKAIAGSIRYPDEAIPM
ncbi:hypothetical protein G6011_11766 [Alternaria panax]|uniref:Uncharacterized protein n=1 Tax=Alternaria panax TaxID=48097 RepID=A0AAD4F8Q7_9PLEO|nr:hypothetical protein G6011_11766 [Alternaria panax]